MHFVPRNPTDGVYVSHGYLRPEIIALRNNVPTRSPKTHRRTSSDNSVGLNQFLNNAVQLLKTKSSSIETEEQFGLLDNVDTNNEKAAEAEAEAVSVEQTSLHDCEIECCKRVTINVAGQKFETQLKTLNRLPSTLLGNHDRRLEFWDSRRHEYFFDRHRPSFPAILYFYQSGGRLKKPVEVPADIFIEELEFFMLGDSVIEAFKVSEGFILDDNDDGDLPDNAIQKAVWVAFEFPDSSLVGKVLATISVLFILTSVVTFCMETMPQFKSSNCINVTATDSLGHVTWRLIPNFTGPLFLIETCCIAWFVFELIIRAVTSPSKLRFIKNILNLIDVASITPYFIFLIMYCISRKCENDSKSGLLSILRVLRVVRIMKLSKHSEGLRILGKTMRVSMSELTMFVLFLGIGVVIFAGAIFYAELQEPDSLFESIPDAFWWAVVSMTTVGYGDMYPVGMLGKCIGSLCVLSGLLAIALPVPVIVTNFNNIYRQTTGRG